MRTAIVASCLLLASCGNEAATPHGATEKAPEVPPGLVYAISTDVVDADAGGPLFAGCVGREPVEINSYGEGRLSPDAMKLAMPWGAGVKLFNLEARTMRELEPDPLPEEWVTDVAWSPDAERLALLTGSGQGTQVRVLDLQDGTFRPIAGAEVGAGPVAWSSDATSFLFNEFNASVGPPGPIRVSRAVRAEDGSWSSSPVLEGEVLIDARGGLLAVRKPTGAIEIVREEGGERIGGIAQGGDIRLAPGGDRMLAWLPDPASNTWSWYVVGLDGAAPEHLQDAFFPSWIAGGLLLFFEVDASDYVRVDPGAVGLLDPARGERRLLPIGARDPLGAPLATRDPSIVQVPSCPAWATDPGHQPLFGSN